ncbi:Predicted endonuclease containing URI domain [gamma proteobacterium HdN1]|nr:Predicted endonuclease containing URI domain [gamma proteobacterium HdN1]
MPAPTQCTAPWFVYILRCADGTLYTGITTDLPRRLIEHNETPRGARYTRPRRPVRLVYAEGHQDRAEASRREYALKALSRSAKEALIQQNSSSSDW